ncbi:MAG: argininosuccinate synthase [Ignavibacteriales bacterium]|nr:argininosuccinate synthase [Ignavibacteriota bacterium]MCB9247818.1 argininosuccinate synthase [Ignavibacteriales bacterium]
MQTNKIVVAYSGGLDTSVMVKWLSKKYNAEIITVTGNLGQKKEIVNIEEKALSTGASKAYVVNLQKEFIEDYAWKALKGGALYEGEYPLATAIGRPLLAKLMVEIAQKEGANMVAHGCTGKGNDQVRFEVGMKTLDPNLQILAPLRDWEFKSREEEIMYAKENNIPISVNLEKPYSIDENIWGIATECGVLEDTKVAPPEDAYQITTNPKNAPQESEIIKLTFNKGIPIKLDGVEMPGAQLVSTLNDLGGKHGIGRLDIIENRVVGIKSREVYEAPGAQLLFAALKQLEKLTLDKDTFRYKQNVSNTYANLIYDGFWFTPLFEALTAFFDKVQERVSGEITLELYKGTIKVLSRESENSLYSQELATYTEEDAFNHKDAEGFINITSLPHQVITRYTVNKTGWVKSKVGESVKK